MREWQETKKELKKQKEEDADDFQEF